MLRMIVKKEKCLCPTNEEQITIYLEEMLNYKELPMLSP